MYSAAPDDRKRIAGLIRDHLARERISREQFAFRTKLGKSTVDKLLIGLFSDRTLAVVEGQTGLSLRAPTVAPPPDRAGSAPYGGVWGTAASEGPGVPDASSIAVLPFTNMSGDPGQDHVADGITEDLITDLSRLRGLSVVARSSTFTYKGRAMDVRRVGHELGVRLVLEGSVRTAVGRIRVTCQLADTGTGRHVWAERYDRELRDIFAVQDEITSRVVSAIEPHLGGEDSFRTPVGPLASIVAQHVLVRAA